MRALVRNWLPVLKVRAAQRALTRLALCTLVAVTLGGCTTPGISVYEAMPIAPTDLSSIHVGATRETVERVLGEPLDSKADGFDQIVIYEYSGGKEGNPEMLLYLPIDYLWSVVSLPTALIFQASGGDVWGEFKRHKGRLIVTYGPDDTVLRLRRRRSITEPTREDQEERNELLARAEQGDAEAQFQLGHSQFRIKNPSQRRKWLCLAANQRHEIAQITLGVRKEFGFEPYEHDYAEAFMWYSLALSQGNDWAAENRARVANKMSPAQIAEAERLAADWKSDPKACEGLAAQIAPAQ